MPPVSATASWLTAEARRKNRAARGPLQSLDTLAQDSLVFHLNDPRNGIVDINRSH